MERKVYQVTYWWSFGNRETSLGIFSTKRLAEGIINRNPCHVCSDTDAEGYSVDPFVLDKEYKHG